MYKNVPAARENVAGTTDLFVQIVNMCPRTIPLGS